MKNQILIRLANLDKLEKNGNFTKEEKNAINSFFNEYVKDEKILDELLKEIGKEKYDTLVDFAKSVHKDFYYVQAMLKKDSKDFIYLFKECFITFDNYSFNKLKKKYDKEILLGVLSLFNKIKDFCLDENLSDNTYKMVLVEYYNCPDEIAAVISKSFGENRMNLMLHKITKALNNSTKQR